MTQTTEDELKNCPFCGSRATGPSLFEWGFAVDCTNATCLVRPVTTFCFKEEDAIKNWNKRAP